MGSKKTGKDKNGLVSDDIAYQELYQEMRRYRDYELSVSTWYTAILLAILGAILTVKFGSTQGSNVLLEKSLARFVTIIVVTLIGSSGMWSVYFSNRRYRHLRDFMFDKKLNLEPAWKKKYEPESIYPKPFHLILLSQLILVITSIVAVLWSQ